MSSKLCAAILGGLAVGFFLRRLATRGGATDDEADVSLAGDDVIPHPMVETTHAITIAAPPSAVWPWIIQGGYRCALSLSAAVLPGGSHHPAHDLARHQSSRRAENSMFFRQWFWADQRSKLIDDVDWA
jgi:hypothetical protein